VWLGFDPEDLGRWANAAGLTAGRELYLALRNGFRIQVRQFHKAGQKNSLQEEKE
jgi:ArsR family transcriptional regulator